MLSREKTKVPENLLSLAKKTESISVGIVCADHSATMESAKQACKLNLIIPTFIGNKEKIAVSQDEFIVPADVVSMLGDGSSDAGSKELYDMMDRVRKEKTGTTKQAPRLANAGGLLPA